MKRILEFFGVAAFLAASTFNLYAQAPTCNNASLNGKYAFAGDIYTPVLNIFEIIVVGQTDTTVDTVGYIVADGNGNLTSARVFESDNNGVSDTGILTSAGTYSIKDCDKGTVSLTSESKTLNFTIDLDHLAATTDPNQFIAATAQGDDTDQGRDEAFNLAHTLDPLGCGSTLNFDGEETGGMQRGYTTAGQKMSGIINIKFASGGTFTGTQKQKVANQPLTISPVSGSYTINSDCTVTASRTIAGVTEAGASVVLSDGYRYLATPWIWQGESCQASTDTYTPEGGNDPNANSQTYPVSTVC
jgi:hypothetical protein